MDKNQLKLNAGFIVYESKLPKQAKLQLMKFIKNEASIAQLKVLLLDGEIIPKVDSITEQIINDRFLVSESALRSIFGILLLTPGLWIAYRGIRAALSERSKKCGIFGMGKERDICMLKVKAQNAKAMVGLVQKSMVNCKQSKNPQKCIAVGQNKIKEFQNKAKKYEDKIKKYASKSPQKSLKATRGVKKAEDPMTKLI